MSLNQKYSVEALKNNLFADSIVKAELTFEDNYAKILNWLAQLETQLPTLRTKSVTITPGTNPADIRMELVLEQPLIKMQ